MITVKGSTLCHLFPQLLPAPDGVWTWVPLAECPGDALLLPQHVVRVLAHAVHPLHVTAHVVRLREELLADTALLFQVHCNWF